MSKATRTSDRIVRKTMRMTFLDPHGTVVEEHDQLVELQPDQDWDPDDHVAQEAVRGPAGQFISAMLAGGLACTVTVREVLTSMSLDSKTEFTASERRRLNAAGRRWLEAVGIDVARVQLLSADDDVHSFRYTEADGNVDELICPNEYLALSDEDQVAYAIAFED